jgi:uncharacterized protein (DUF1778 family)
MPKKIRNTKKLPSPSVVQLPCRARPHEAALIRKAAQLDSRGNYTSFIVGAAVMAAKASLAAHGLVEADVLTETLKKSA